ncbi:hypothetical protein BD770DRAFT_166641 [Pilaira anomala]|nr:hypothetical protein BD770DRAFT_166641 [Pilaira anomala]
MVFVINGVKHACASCIRGHRVKKCNHKERPMVPLVKRGRQISQCTHCRDLRLTNRSHVKCTCAIASTPNPINGCLCEVLLTCTCVASHLQDVKEDGTAYSPSSSSTGCCSTPNSTASTIIDPSPSFMNQKETSLTADNSIVVDQQVILNRTIDDTDISALFHFLQDDLDKFLSK